MNVIGEWRSQNNNVIEGDVYWKMKQMNNIIVQGEVDQFLGVQNMKQIDIYGVHNDQGVEDWQTMQCLDVVIGQVQF